MAESAQAGAVETLETAASSSGRDVAPQRPVKAPSQLSLEEASTRAGRSQVLLLLRLVVLLLLSKQACWKMLQRIDTSRFVT